MNLADPWRQWEITQVEHDGQCEKLGIKVGWKFKSVDDKLISEENHYDVKKQLGRGAKSKIKFLVPVTVHYIFLLFAITRFKKKRNVLGNNFEHKHIFDFYLINFLNNFKMKKIFSGTCSQMLCGNFDAN